MPSARFVCALALAGAALLGVAAAELPVAAEWNVAVDSGMRVATAVSVLNQCHAPHRFMLVADTAAQRWLQLDGGNDIALAPGAASAVPAAVDVRELDPGQHGGALTLRCLDCMAEPGCAAQQVAARLTARWPPQALADSTAFATDSLLVLPAGDARGAATLAAELGLRVRRVLVLGALSETWLEVEPLAPVPIADLIARIEIDPRLRTVQPNFIFQTAAEDPMRTLQYALRQMHVDPSRRGGGRGVTLAIVDTGIATTHPDLEHAAWIRSDWVGDAAADGIAEAHGTLVAGLIAAQPDNGIGIAGIAPRVTLLAARACRSREGEAMGLCQSAALVPAIDWALAKGARVINLSVAGPRDPLLLRILRAGLARQVVVVAAAGNRGPDAAPLYPAAEPGVIGVGAVDAAGQPYARGAKGPHVAVAAPGVEVMSTWPGGEFRAATGTSFAAAQVSGLIALLLELKPTLDAAAVRRAIDIAAPGAGLIDACKLLGDPC